MLPDKVLKKVFYIQAIVALMISVKAHGQLYPVQVTPQLVPPYSVYLSDYASSGSEKLRVIVLQRDLSRPAYQIRLVMNVEWNGKVIMRTSRAFNPPPLNLSPGIPTVISGAELASYLDSRNIDFVGYSREQYERTRALPEGSYRISFTAYDYSRQDVQVSAEGNSFYYLAKSEPPLINYPSCGTKIPSKTPQQIIFSWLPRNTASPNSALETEYEFSLYETRPAGRNPNDVVLTTQPVFRTRTQFTQLIYGPAEPVLLTDITYVWRVQAIDRNGKDAFRNNGYSEVCTFFYSSTAAPFEIGTVKDFQAVGETENRGKVSWTADAFDSYRVEYKKAGQGFEWFKSDIKDAELKIFDLEPDTEYEARVQARKSGYFGPFTDVVKFRTLPARVAHCGENPGLPDINNPGSPLTDAITGMTVNARGQEMVLTQITPGGRDGWYAGYGRVTLKYLGASYPVKFDRIFINDNREVVLGRIDVLTNGTAHLPEAQVASVNADRVRENRDEWKDTEFHEEVFKYDDIDIEGVLIDDVTGIITITDATGQSIINDEITPILVDAPERAVIIEDKNGDQWVVEKDKSTGKTKVTRVGGGGLGSGSNASSIVQADPIKDRIIVLILEQFEEEIAAWLRVNGKGGEDDPDILLAEEMPEAFPRHAAFLTHLKTEVIPYFKEHLEKLRSDVEQSNKATLDKTAKIFGTKDDVEWTKVEANEQKVLRNAIGNSLMKLSGGEINTSEIMDLVPDCGRQHAGKDKPLGSLFLIVYPEECSYMKEGIVNYYISRGYGKYLCVEERFSLIKCLATGIVSGDEEQSIITLFNEVSRAHAASLLTLLSADNSGLLRNIDDGFQFGNYVTVFKAIQEVYLNGTTQDVLDAEVQKIDNTFLSDKTRQEKVQQNYFTWFEGGILKAMFADDFVFSRFDDVRIADDGTVSFDYATDPRQTGEATTPITIKPFALVGMHVRGNTNEVLEAGNGNMVYVPGIMLPLLISKKETAEFFEALNSTAVATGIGSIVSGTTRFVIASGGIDILLGGSGLVVDSYKDDILKMQNGEAFLDAYVLVNKAFLIYFGSRTVIQLTQALPKLNTAFSTVKNSDDFAKLKLTNPSKAAQIEKEVDAVVKKADEILIIHTGDGFEKLSSKRVALGLPPAGAAADDATVSYLKLGDSEFYGVNSKYQSPKTPVTLKVNAQTRTHAEAEVVQKAVDAGLKGKFKSAEMWVDRDPCKACGINNGIGSLARELGVDEIVVHSTSGTQSFYPPK